MQTDLLLGDLGNQIEIPHSENADVEYYTTYPKTSEKSTGNPTSGCACTQGNPFVVRSFLVKTPEKNNGKPGCACVHPREPLRGHVNVGHVYQHFVLLL